MSAPATPAPASPDPASSDPASPGPSSPDAASSDPALVTPGSGGVAGQRTATHLRRTPRVVAGVLAGVVALAGAGGWVAAQQPRADAAGPAVSGAQPAAVAAAVAPRLRVLGLRDGRLAWQDRVRLQARDGRLEVVTVTGPDGRPVPGALTPDGGWRASTTSVPASNYRVTAQVRDLAGEVRTLQATVRTRAAQDLLGAGLSPGDGRVVGTGQPVVLRLDRPVEDPAARTALQDRLEVRSTPAVDGAWRWVSSTELHYRGPRFWEPGTSISVVADLDGLALPDGVWGSGRRTTTFTVGQALHSVVDTRQHTMTVRRGGKVLRVMKASMGKPQFATRNGTFLVLEKFAERVMDSATVDLPPGTPAYRTAVKHAVRISYSGTFTHGAPWSVPSQGRANVSHGCINLSPADAEWFFDLAQRGDVVEVVGSTRGPLPHDAGSVDWNMSFAEWAGA